MNEFKLIVAGGREFAEFDLLCIELNDLAEGFYKDRAVSIVSGMARGADALGVTFARMNHVKLYEFPADWAKDGRGAGYKRNAEMGNFADGLLAFWDGQSRGTANMIEYMQSLKKPVHIVRYSTQPFPKAGPDVGDGGY